MWWADAWNFFVVGILLSNTVLFTQDEKESQWCHTDYSGDCQNRRVHNQSSYRGVPGQRGQILNGSGAKHSNGRGKPFFLCHTKTVHFKLFLY